MIEQEEKILAEFNNLKSSLAIWGAFVDSQIVDLLGNNNLKHEIKIYPAFRMKDDKSFLSKALWRKKEYDNPILKIEDKIGTRVVLLKSDDIEPTSNALLQYEGWNSKVTKSIKESIEGAPKEFNYQSLHIVVFPKNGDSRFDKSIIELLTCEIQIRTLLQHAFAEISHDSTYKGPYKNDADIIRSLSKSMALMEATDDYFITIFKMMTDDKRRYKNYVNEITTLFSQNYKTDYRKDDLDVLLTDDIFELLEQRNVSIDELTEFTIKQNEYIKGAIKDNKTHIFSQPVILLIYYYIENNPTFIKKNWPLSLEALKEVYQGFGVSFE